MNKNKMMRKIRNEKLARLPKLNHKIIIPATTRINNRRSGTRNNNPINYAYMDFIKMEIH